MAKKRRRRSSSSKRSNDEYPGWAWGVFGLAVGLSVAAAVWVSDRSKPAATVAEEPVVAAPAPADAAAYDDNGEDQPVAVVEPGRYVLQAGSFSTYDDADRRRAELALHGIESRIQRVTIDGATYHRVRIGPTSDLDELNMLRSRLRAANIDVMRIRFDD